MSARSLKGPDTRAAHRVCSAASSQNRAGLKAPPGSNIYIPRIGWTSEIENCRIVSEAAAAFFRKRGMALSHFTSMQGGRPKLTPEPKVRTGASGKSSKSAEHSFRL